MLDVSISSRLENETEPVTTRATFGTLLKLEQFFKLDSAIEAVQTGKLEYMAWLAWESRRHAGMTVPPWERFFDTIEDCNLESDNDVPLAEEAPPTS